MVLGRGRAPGKVILFGEHAVVYGRPALAVPVMEVRAEAIVEAGAPGRGLVIHAADLGEEIALHSAPADHPLAVAARLTLARLGLSPTPQLAGTDLANAVSTEPDWRVTIRSTIPIAGGMGSGAAVTTALVRALADAANTQYPIPPLPLSPATVSALVYEVEKLHHGTPSGIDNTVIAYEQPVHFVRGRPPEPFPVGRPFTLAIADSGIASPTRIAVADVRRAWEREPARFEALFDRIATIVEAAREAIVAGNPEKLGPLMNENHALLAELGVSCPELERLAAAARAAGASGAKLSGAGRGGNLIALVTAATAPAVAEALRVAGAARVIVTEVNQLWPYRNRVLAQFLVSICRFAATRPATA